MAEFTEEQKIFACELLGAGKPPTVVAKAMVEEFALKVQPTTSQLSRYNADRPSGTKLSPELKEVFYTAQAKARLDIDSVAISYQAWRVNELMEMYWDARKGKNSVLAASLLEQAAKEKGGMYTQRVSGASPTEVKEYIREKLAPVRRAIDAFVTDEEERERVMDSVRKAEHVEGGGG